MNSQQTPKPRRTYASFFDWPNKPTKECGVVRSFNEALAAAGEETFQSLMASESDPPDCVATDIHGSKVGIEVTELVCRGAIECNLKGDAVYRDWQQDQVIDALQDIIREKDHKCRNVSGVSRLLLLIHTDEPVIDYEAYRLVLEHHTFETPKYFDEVILLFSYDPRQETYLYVRLGFLKADHAQ